MITFVSDVAAGNKVWLGATDIETEGTFKWNSGPTLSYTNWHIRKGQLINYGHRDHEIIVGI